VTDLPDRLHSQDPLARFRYKIAENARAWLGFVRDERPESAALLREFANLNRAAAQALREPTAWAAGVPLVVALWPFIDWRGYWLAWRGILDQALMVCRRQEDLVAEVEITDQLGEVARTLGENRAALAWQEQALKLARRLGDQAIIGRVLVHLSQQHLPQGHYQAAQACCEEAIALLTPLGAEDEIAIAHNNWGIACSEDGQMELALAHLVLAETMFEAQGNRRGQAKAIHNQAETHLRQQRGAEAGILYERAIALALDAGDEVSAVRPRTSLAILLHQQGQHEAALALHREIEIVYRRLGDRPMLARVINNEGAFLLALGRQDDATRAYEQAAHMHLESGNLGDAAVSLLNWAEILLDRGDAEQAQTRLGQAGELLGALPDSPSPVRQYFAALLERATVERASVQATSR
jgi:tetratricopeptide (TPR) repeat protein